MDKNQVEIQLYDERQSRINALIQLLKRSDHKARKYLDGEYTAEEYALIAEQAKAWRTEMRALEAEIAAKNGGEM
jgi:hypothetical protein